MTGTLLPAELRPSVVGVIHRRADESDIAFTFDGWLRSFRASHAAGLIPMRDYYDVYRRVIEGVLARPGVGVWVAEHSTEGGVTLGWLCAEPNWGKFGLVHYVYVRESARRSGVARGLLRAAGIGDQFTYSFKSGAVDKKRIPRTLWDPLVIR